MIYAVILAGGSGTRMKSAKIPKQFIVLGDKTILNHTVDKFLFVSKVDRIIVAAPKVWLRHTMDMFSGDKYERVDICEGGKTRQESLYKAVKYIEEKYKNIEDLIISHDVARPFVSYRIINENIEALERYEAVDTVIPATDTIVRSDSGKVITSIPDRAKMYMGQTPQSFRRTTYTKIYESLSNDYLERVTDAARILSDNGCSVALVQGDESNIKITTDHDLQIAKFLISKKD